MPIVIDVNCMGRVFDKTNSEHKEFSDVLIFIKEGKGRLIYGGTKYLSELKVSRAYIGVLTELRKAGRAVAIRNDAVDAATKRVIAATSGKGCDDPHVIGLLAASNCALLCSMDKRSYPFVRDRSLYSKDSVRVRIYSSSRNREILRPQGARLWNVA